MTVDNFRYLPKSFAAYYDTRGKEPVDPVWAPMLVPIESAQVALLTSAGIFLPDSQEPFDLEREKQEPTWGDPSWRLLPKELGDVNPEQSYDIAHLHINPDPIHDDLEVALPIRAFTKLAEQGRIGSVAAEHYSVMGFQAPGIEEWLTTTGPEIAAHARQADIDLLVLAPV